VPADRGAGGEIDLIFEVSTTPPLDTEIDSQSYKAGFSSPVPGPIATGCYLVRQRSGIPPDEWELRYPDEAVEGSYRQNLEA